MQQPVPHAIVPGHLQKHCDNHKLMGCHLEGEVDLFLWHCKIPGPTGSMWEGGLYPLDLKFTENYPNAPPECYFPQHFYHPNVYPAGKVRALLLSACQRLPTRTCGVHEDAWLLVLVGSHNGFKRTMLVWAPPAL